MSPIRINQRQIEVLLDDWNENGRSKRLLGFIDIGVGYLSLGHPYVLQTGKVCTWSCEKRPGCVLIEVKSAWPTAGNLIRQLNLYKNCAPRGFHGDRHHLLVGPDESVNQLVNEHDYRLATFDSNVKNFTLIPDTKHKIVELADATF